MVFHDPQDLEKGCSPFNPGFLPKNKWSITASGYQSCRPAWSVLIRVKQKMSYPSQYAVRNDIRHFMSALGWECLNLRIRTACREMKRWCCFKQTKRVREGGRARVKNYLGADTVAHEQVPSEGRHRGKGREEGEPMKNGTRPTILA